MTEVLEIGSHTTDAIVAGHLTNQIGSLILHFATAVKTDSQLINPVFIGESRYSAAYRPIASNRHLLDMEGLLSAKNGIDCSWLKSWLRKPLLTLLGNYPLSADDSPSIDTVHTTFSNGISVLTFRFETPYAETWYMPH